VDVEEIEKNNEQNPEVKKDLDALEKEKEEYEEEHPEKDVEVEETEFSLTEDEIDEWINELTTLKEEKKQITLSVDEETDLKINYEESDESEETEEEE